MDSSLVAASRSEHTVGAVVGVQKSYVSRDLTSCVTAGMQEICQAGCVACDLPSIF
jgi:hypothetical protein